MNNKEKIKTLKKLARKKDTSAILELAELLGGVKTKKGLRLCEKAARLGDEIAKHKLIAHFYGEGMRFVQKNAHFPGEYSYEVYMNFDKAQKYIKSLSVFDEESEKTEKVIEKVLWELN